MLVFYNERLVFLAVPKTGSTAYQSALSAQADIVVSNPPELKHAPVYRYNRFFRPMFEKVCNAEMETIAVIREPVSWLGSWYRYRQRPFMKGKPNSTHDIDFADFVRAYLQGDQPSFANVGCQSKFLEPRPNGTRVNRLFKYETPEVLNRFLEERLSVKLELQWENASPPGDISLPPGVEARLRQKYALDFSLHEDAD